MIIKATYNSLRPACAKSGSVQKIENIFQLSYNIFSAACAKSGDMKGAVFLFSNVALWVTLLCDPVLQCKKNQMYQTLAGNAFCDRWTLCGAPSVQKPNVFIGLPPLKGLGGEAPRIKRRIGGAAAPQRRVWGAGAPRDMAGGVGGGSTPGGPLHKPCICSSGFSTVRANKLCFRNVA